MNSFPGEPGVAWPRTVLEDGTGENPDPTFPAYRGQAIEGACASVGAEF